MNAPASLRSERDNRLIENLVARAPLLGGASPSQLSAIARRCWTLGARRQALIAERGVRLPGILGVSYGTAKLALCDADRKERVLRLVQAGETFGEAAALTGRPAPYEVRALTECKIVVIPAAAVLAMLEVDGRAARQVVHTLSVRNFELLHELHSSSMRRTAQRLASYLDSLAEAAGATLPCTVRLPATKTVIASRLNMKKETLSRLLRSLADRGLIEVRRGDIAILDRARLAEVTG